MTTFFGARTLLFGNGKPGFASFYTIGSGLFLEISFRIKGIDYFLTDFTRFIEQRQVGGIADRLRCDGSIDDQFTLMTALFSGSDSDAGACSKKSC